MKKIIVKGFKNGQAIDIEVSNLFLGSADFLRPDNMAQVEEMFDTFIKAKGNAIDTAEHYRYAEQAIGEWIKKTGRRNEIVIFTKGCHPTREARHINRVNKECIREDIEKSLKILGVDCIEMFALHRDDRSVSVKEIMDELNYQINIGHICAAGVSNWELDRIIEANNYAKENGLHPLTFNSVNLSLARPLKPRWPGCISASEEMIEWHKNNDIALISWSSQAGGFFSGRFDRLNCPDEEIKECYYTNENWTRYDRCIEIAQKKNKTPIQIALAWLLHQPFVVAAVIGPETILELQNSIEGSDVELTALELEYLDLKGNKYE